MPTGNGSRLENLVSNSMKPLSPYTQGYNTACWIARARGGSRGPQWHADTLKLTGEAREEFIQGYEAAMDHMAAQEQEDES